MSASVTEIAKNTSEAARASRRRPQRVAEETNRTVATGESSIEIGQSSRSSRPSWNRPTLLRAQRHDRSGQRAKPAGLRGRRERSEGAGQADGGGDRGHQPEDRRHPERHARRQTAIEEISGSSPRSTSSRTRSRARSEQSATTNEIARNASEAATGSTEIRATSRTSRSRQATARPEGASNTLTAAQELSKLAGDPRCWSRRPTFTKLEAARLRTGPLDHMRLIIDDLWPCGDASRPTCRAAGDPERRRGRPGRREVLGKREGLKSRRLDWDMPRMNGTDFVRHVKKDPRWQNMKLVMVTAHVNPDDIMEVPHHGRRRLPHEARVFGDDRRQVPHPRTRRLTA